MDKMEGPNIFTLQRHIPYQKQSIEPNFDPPSFSQDTPFKSFIWQNINE